MFDIGWSELLVLAVVAIIVVGPKDLPRLMRNIGHYAGKLRRAAGDFQRQFEEAMRESEVPEMKQALDSVRVDTPPLDQPVMLANPQDAAATETPVAPKQARKRGPAKPKGTSAKTAAKRRGKKPAEPA